MTDRLPPGSIVRVVVDLPLPVAASPAEIIEWLDFEWLPHGEDVPPGNPLGGQFMPWAIKEIVVEDTGLELIRTVEPRGAGSRVTRIIQPRDRE